MRHSSVMAARSTPHSLHANSGQAAAPHQSHMFAPQALDPHRKSLPAPACALAWAQKRQSSHACVVHVCLDPGPMCLNQDSRQPTSHGGTSAQLETACVLRAPCATFVCAPRAPHAPRSNYSRASCSVCHVHVCSTCSACSPRLHVTSHHSHSHLPYLLFSSACQVFPSARHQLHVS